MLSLFFFSILLFIQLPKMFFLFAYSYTTFCFSDPFTFQKLVGFYPLVCNSIRQPLTFFSWLFLTNLCFLYTYASQLHFVEGALESRLLRTFFGAQLLLPSCWHNDFVLLNFLLVFPVFNNSRFP